MSSYDPSLRSDPLCKAMMCIILSRYFFKQTPSATATRKGTVAADEDKKDDDDDDESRNARSTTDKKNTLKKSDTFSKIPAASGDGDDGDKVAKENGGG